jgi:hypothetical protein
VAQDWLAPLQSCKGADQLEYPPRLAAQATQEARNEANKDRSGKTGDENAVGTGDDQGSKIDVDECEWDSDESDADVTMADVRGEMDPFIDEEMD